MTHALAADDLDAVTLAPLWRDAVVGASVAAMAAAAGLGTHYEVGVAPWLSMVAAGVTAAALWGAHRQLGRPAPVPASPVRTKRPRPAKSAPTVTTQSPSIPTPSEPAPSNPASARVAEADPVPQVSAPKIEKPELSSFTPRTGPAADTAAATSRSQPPPMPAIDPEAQFLRLQGLVRQLATDVEGPRAETVDPDRAAVSAPAVALPLTVGFAPAPAPVQPAALAAASPLAQRLAEAIASERLDVLLEPIQVLSESRARHFEISVRFRAADGDVLPVDDVARVARSTGLASSIDALKLPRVAKVVQKVLSRGGSPSDVLTALAGASLTDHAFLEAFAKTFADGAPAPLVLSFPQADVRAFARVHWSALNALGDMGLRFALNDVTDLDMDFELLRARSFVFAKLDADVFLNGLSCGGAVVPAADICKHIADAGLSLIVARLDTEEQLGRVAAYGVPFGQGRLYGGARPVKSDILR